VWLPDHTDALAAVERQVEYDEALPLAIERLWCGTKDDLASARAVASAFSYLYFK
jgi:hypothetical protein